MPRIAGIATPKYRRHRATGQAVTTISGRDHYLGPWKSKASRIEYDRLIGEWLAAGRRTTPVNTANVTVAELCQAYKRYAESYYLHGGMLDNIAAAMRTLRLRYGDTSAVEFGPLALKAVRLQFVDEGKARSYCNRLTDLIRRAFKWAASEQLIPMLTWQSLTTVAGLRRGHTEAHEKEPITPVDDATVETTLPHLPATIADMVRLQRLTGMRPDEVCRMRSGDIDRTGNVWSYKPAQHKTAHHGKQRVIFIGPKGQTILRRYLLRAADTFCFVPAEVVAAQLVKRHAARKTPLSCGNRPGTNCVRRKVKRKAGKRYTVAAYRRAIHRACDVADRMVRKADPSVEAATRIIPRWSPNRLRHSAATQIRKRFGIESAQVVLGHAKPDTTLVYAQADMEKAASIMEQVG